MSVTVTLPLATEVGEINGTVTCDDNNASINPLAIDVCDGIDNDCMGDIDSADPDCDLGCTFDATLPCALF